MVRLAQTLVAGIDPSLTNTAVVVGSTGVHDVRTFSSEPRGTHVEARMARCERLVNEIVDFVRDNAVEVVCIEGYSYGSNMPGHHAIVEYGGLLRYRLVPHCAIYEVAPSTLKKFATGKGNGSKVPMISAITKRYGVEFRSDDEYDAFALFRLALCVAGTVEPETLAQAESIKKVVETRNGKAH